MNRRRITSPLLWTMLAVWTLSGCGQLPHESALREMQPDSKTLFVVMGGNTTCKEGPDRLWTPLLSTLARKFFNSRSEWKEQAGLESNYLVSCYSPLDMMAFTSDLLGLRIQFGATSKFVKKAKTMIESSTDRVFLVGHSYGGWLAMKTALALNPSVKLEGLITIDPISRVDCSYTRPEGCQQAPQDFSPSDKQELQRRTKYWGNFFQTQTPYLHSSAIPEAHQNVQISASHGAIDVDPGVWAVIEEKVL